MEHIERGSVHFLHAYPEDFPSAPQAWSPEGLAPHPFRPAFDVIFVYDAAGDSLDIYFEGGKKTVQRLWALFAEVTFGIGQLPEQPKPIYDLAPLSSPGFTLPVPADAGGTVDLRMKGLTFRVSGTATTITP